MTMRNLIPIYRRPICRRCLAIAILAITALTMPSPIQSLLLRPAFAQGRALAAPNMPGVGIHVIQPGDTLFHLSMRYGLPARELAEMNGRSIQGVLLPGQPLWVPLASAVNARADEPAQPAQAPAAAAAHGTASSFGRIDADAQAPQTRQPSATANSLATYTSVNSLASYTIVPGDTLFSVSRRFGAAVEDLKRWNGLPADGSIRAGDSLALTGSSAGTGSPGSLTIPVNTLGAVVNYAADTADTADTADMANTADTANMADTAYAASAQLDSTYTVVPGDTLTAIAARFHSTALGLKQQNGLASDAIAAGQTISVPRPGAGAAGASGAKRIEVDVSDERMLVWQGNTLVWNFVVSTGLAGTPTRRGSFAVQSKIPNAWSSAYQLWMPDWLGIYNAGSSENGIHALPIINGQRLWAGYLGAPISYGCVVLGIEDAETLYDWADIGVPVVIHD